MVRGFGLALRRGIGASGRTRLRLIAFGINGVVKSGGISVSLEVEQIPGHPDMRDA